MFKIVIANSLRRCVDQEPDPDCAQIQRDLADKIERYAGSLDDKEIQEILVQAWQICSSY